MDHIVHRPQPYTGLLLPHWYHSRPLICSLPFGKVHFSGVRNVWGPLIKAGPTVKIPGQVIGDSKISFHLRYIYDTLKMSKTSVSLQDEWRFLKMFPMLLCSAGNRPGNLDNVTRPLLTFLCKVQSSAQEAH